MKFARGKYMNLWRELTRAQYRIRDQSTVFGFLWSLLNPLVAVGLLFALFSTQLRSDIEFYGLYLLIGTVYYTHFSNATSASVTVLQSMSGLTRDGIFPKDLLVLASISTHTIDFFISTVLCIVIAAFSGVPITTAILALPLVLVMQVMLVLWVSLLLSSFFVFVRDLLHIYNVFLRLLFFVTPVFYGASFVGGGFGRYVLLANPLSHSITFARTLVLNGQLFDLRQFTALFTINGIMLFASYKIFKRLEPTFSENV